MPAETHVATDPDTHAETHADTHAETHADMHAKTPTEAPPGLRAEMPVEVAVIEADEADITR